MDVYLHILGTEWVNFEEKLKSLPLAQKNARSFVRFFLSGGLEIWNRETWQKYSKDESISADEIAENMTMLGI